MADFQGDIRDSFRRVCQACGAWAQNAKYADAQWRYYCNDHWPFGRLHHHPPTLVVTSAEESKTFLRIPVDEDETRG